MCENSNVNGNTERNESRLINISHSPVFPPKTGMRAFHCVTSILERNGGERVSMRGMEFTALMLHQCAAVVAVNLQIDQTAEPKGSGALS